MFSRGTYFFSDINFKAPRGPVNNEKFYNLLEVPVGASDAEIKKAYRRLAIKHHPDKGGDPETFKNMSRAYQVLSDPDKRKAYDEYGEEGLDDDGNDHTTSDFFELILGNIKNRGVPKKRRGEDIDHVIEITLAEAYTGKVIKHPVTRNIQCDKCDGQGGSVSETCDVCNGSGIAREILLLGPVSQQIHKPCTKCKNGRIVPKGKQCTKCKGSCVIEQKKVLEVYVQPGVLNNQNYKFTGEADQLPGTVPGDVNIIIRIKENEDIQRKGAHLLIKRDVNLYEALTGFQFEFKHLDGRRLLITNQPGEVLEPGCTKVVEDEGMPVVGTSFEKGHLIFTFNIVMPRYNELKLQGDVLKSALKQILPNSFIPKAYNHNDYEVHVVKKFISDVHMNNPRHRKAADKSRQQFTEKLLYDISFMF